MIAFKKAFERFKEKFFQNDSLTYEEQSTHISSDGHVHITKIKKTGEPARVDVARIMRETEELFNDF